MSNDDLVTPELSEDEKQLQLFYLDTPFTANFSHSIETLIGAPRFVRGKGSVVRMDSKKPKIIERLYVDRDRTHKVTITPAILKAEDNKTKNAAPKEELYYPNTDVELIEEVLIKFGVSGAGKMIEGGGDSKPVFAVHFTINSLVKELKKRGHTRSSAEVIRTLKIGAKCNIEMDIPMLNGKTVNISTPIFKNLILVDREDYESGQGSGSNTCYLELHPLVVACIHFGLFRKYNYQRSMSFKRPLAAWLYRRLSHYYIQSGDPKGYTIKLSTIYTLYGFNRESDKASVIHKDVAKALDELKGKEGKGDIDWDYERIPDPNDARKTIDYKYHIFPTQSFTNAMVYFNSDFEERNGKTIKQMELLDLSDYSTSTTPQ